MKDFEERHFRKNGLNNMVTKLSKWIKFYSDKILKEHRFNSSCLQSHFLSTFHLYQYEVEILSSNSIQKSSIMGNVRISRFLPTVEFVKKYNDVAYRFFIKGDDGKVYPYTFISHPFIKNIRKENNASHFLNFLNPVLMEKRETAKYFLKINVPDIITLTSDVHIVCDDESSVSLVDIYNEHSTQIGGGDPLHQFYNLMLIRREEELDEPITYCNQAFMLDVFKEVQKNLVPETILKTWAKAVYPCTADYLEFRTQVAKDIALSGALKKVFCLTFQCPDNIFIHQETGHITNFRFQLKQSTSDSSFSSKPVPFRLTPNISNFLTPAEVKGTFIPVMQATSNSFLRQNSLVENLFKIFWLNDIIQGQDKMCLLEECRGKIFSNANVVSQNMKELSNLEQLECLIQSAEDPNNLCQMNPSYFPWL